MKKKVLYIGLDVHKNTIDVAVTSDRANGKVRSYGKINSALESLSKLVSKLQKKTTNCALSMKPGPVVTRSTAISILRISTAPWLPLP